MCFFSRLKNRFIYIWANQSHDSKRNYLISRGCQIGEGTRFNCSIGAFGTEPYLISVGKDCLFAAEIRLITHDGGIAVLNNLNYFGGKRMDKIASLKIGDNVYIGTGAYIMPGVSVGNNCIIGAKSVVTKDVPDNSVAVGIPAVVVKSIDDYYRSALTKGQLHPTARLSFKEKKNTMKIRA